ncbi:MULTISPECIES: hypothetical protein [Salimicrobium]|uniref:YesK-like protein n=1 Tax=Salimicrobium humidisoli TaxID=2029857 RepID=A0ABX4HWL7_9BACI|nr:MULTISPECIES: hypothetical protein [Salimicrobium]PBB06881.1 hypothetical protein CKW00_00005 [Salimicrobium humidisoli]
MLEVSLLAFIIILIAAVSVLTLKNKNYKKKKSNEVISFIFVSISSNSLGLVFFNSTWALVFYGIGFLTLLVALVVAFKMKTYTRSIKSSTQ